MSGKAPPVTTPDGRYIVVRSRLWRASDPNLPPQLERTLVEALMAARRAVKAALKQADAEALRRARAQVQAAKEALGERAAVWWTDGAPDLNRKPIRNTHYKDWWDRIASP